MTSEHNLEEPKEEEEDLERWMGEGGAPQDPYDTLEKLDETLSVERRPHRPRKDIATRPQKTRREQDSMGTLEVPEEAYYGASTQRAVINFPISDLRFPSSFIRALGLVKLVAARANRDLGLLDESLCSAIEQAAEEVADGDFDDDFVVDVFQTGSGTSTNTNANEVIANRATEILGGGPGQPRVHPNDHVNLGQSSNDVIPTVIHLAALALIDEELIPALQALQAGLETKKQEFWGVIKTGRTHLQDATPVRLGQEFGGYAAQVEMSLKALDVAKERLCQVAIGGTAVGTGINAHPELASRIATRLSEMTGRPIREAGDHFLAQGTLDGVLQASATLRGVAIGLGKIANDIRWLGSGPRAGLGELQLPAVQPGSSIMPGKVNPVIAESLIQVAAQVVGNDATVAVAAQGGTFELNTMMPVAAYNLLQSVSLLAAAARNFEVRCVSGLRATEVGPRLAGRSVMLATALTPAIGYDLAAEVAKEADRSGRSVREVAAERTSIAAADLDRLLDPALMTEPGAKGE